MPQTKYIEVDKSKDVIEKIEELTKQINDLKNIKVEQPPQPPQPTPPLSPPPQPQPKKRSLLEIAKEKRSTKSQYYSNLFNNSHAKK